MAAFFMLFLLLGAVFDDGAIGFSEYLNKGYRLTEKIFLQRVFYF